METRGMLKDISVLNDIEITFVLDKNTSLSAIDDLINKELDIVAIQHKEKRSLDANAYFHVLVNKLARIMKTSDDEMKIKMNLQYGTVATDDTGMKCGVKVPKSTNIISFYPYAKWIGEVEENGKMFDKYLFYKRTSELNTKEMGELIDGVVTECHEQGIETLPPEKLKSIKEAWGI